MRAWEDESAASYLVAILAVPTFLLAVIAILVWRLA